MGWVKIPWYDEDPMRDHVLDVPAADHKECLFHERLYNILRRLTWSYRVDRFGKPLVVRVDRLPW